MDKDEHDYWMDMSYEQAKELFLLELSNQPGNKDEKVCLWKERVGDVAVYRSLNEIIAEVESNSDEGRSHVEFFIVAQLDRILNEPPRAYARGIPLIKQRCCLP